MNGVVTLGSGVLAIVGTSGPTPKVTIPFMGLQIMTYIHTSEIDE